MKKNRICMHDYLRRAYDELTNQSKRPDIKLEDQQIGVIIYRDRSSNDHIRGATQTETFDTMRALEYMFSLASINNIWYAFYCYER